MLGELKLKSCAHQETPQRLSQTCLWVFECLLWSYGSAVHYRGLECKSRKSRDNWSNRQIWPWSTEWSRTKANRVLLRERTDLNTLFQQHKRRLYTWTLPDGQHQIILIIFFSGKDREALYSQRKQDRELTVAQIMNSLLPNSNLNWRK